MPIVTLPQRPQVDYGQLGQVLGQSVFPMAGMQEKLLPLLLQEQFKSQLQRQRQRELIQELTQGGNGPMGDFDISIGPSGITYKQKSPKQKLEDIQAQEDLGFFQGQPSLPQVVRATPSLMGQPSPEAVVGAPISPPPGVPDLPPSERRKAQVAVIEQEIKAKGKERVEQLKRGRQLKETVNAFRGIVGQYKGMVEEREGMETGLVPGLIGAAKAKAFQKGVPRTAAFEGQRTETTFRLNSILTGQNRVIRGVIGMIQATLPTRLDPADMAAQKVTQSISNAYKLTKSFKQAGYTPDRLNAMSQEELDAIPAESLVAGYDLTPIEERELEALIKDVLGTKAEKARAFPEFALPSVVKKTGNKREQYNRLREQGISPVEARKRVGL